MTLKLVHLFPRELGIFGDGGNLFAVQKRAEWSGIPTTTVSVNLDDVIPNDGDIYFVGSGSTSGLRAVSHRVPDISTALASALAGGASIVAISGGMHLLCTSISFADGTTLAGAGLIDATVIPRDSRRVGESSEKYAGFINTGHAMSIDDGNNTFERSGIVGSYLHGPLLPMNPDIADRLILAHSGVSVAHDDPRVIRATVAAENARAAIRSRLGI